MDSKNKTVKTVMLEELKESMAGCTGCKLSTTRKNIVFGEGNPDARVMFIGEGPGKDEDIQGRPFVGRAGILLTAIIEKGMKLRRSDVYIGNVVKCRPTVNLEGTRDRPPEDDEKEACGDYLKKQISIIRPEVIITLGNPATRFLLNTKQGITKMRGTWYTYEGIPVMPTFHPSYILRNGGDSSPLKKLVWEDIKKVLEYLEKGTRDAEDVNNETNETIKLTTRHNNDTVQGSLF